MAPTGPRNVDLSTGRGRPARSTQWARADDSDNAPACTDLAFGPTDDIAADDRDKRDPGHASPRLLRARPEPPAAWDRLGAAGWRHLHVPKRSGVGLDLRARARIPDSMTTRLKRAIVAMLEHADTVLLHRLHLDRWFGCGLAALSARLDERWGTSEWQDVALGPSGNPVGRP